MLDPKRYWSPKRGEGEAVKWLRANADCAGDDCLTWPFSRNPETGYGMFGYLGVQRYAHRFMCEMVNGPAPDDKPIAAHSCGKGHDGCVHPKHLSWKSIADNLEDRREHGTIWQNTCGRLGKLRPIQIAQIRELKGVKSQYDLARMFGVKRAAIQYWHNHDRAWVGPGTSESAIWRRKKKVANATASSR